MGRLRKSRWPAIVPALGGQVLTATSQCIFFTEDKIEMAMSLIRQSTFDERGLCLLSAVERKWSSVLHASASDAEVDIGACAAMSAP